MRKVIRPAGAGGSWGRRITGVSGGVREGMEREGWKGRGREGGRGGWGDGV